MEGDETVPTKGNWPVDPQDDVPISKDRIWVDGCFDFSHHGHAGALLQAKRLGKELLVGIHSDEAIAHHKAPTVMNLKERVAAVDACRWSTKSIPHAPYVTYLPWISHYGCQYVVHGDDITSDSSGEDCYRFVKAAGRFLVVKRTPGISTTDLVGRILLCTRTHFIKSLRNRLAGDEGNGSPEERKVTGEDMMQRIRDYATDASGLKPGSKVFLWRGSQDAAGVATSQEIGIFDEIIEGNGPRPGQRIVYVDGGFDLFSSGHIEFLRRVIDVEKQLAKARGDDQERPAFVVAGVHDDTVINHWKGLNYPIMNIFERGLCVLQCRYVDSVVFSAPFNPTISFLKHLPFGLPDAVYHGPTSFVPLDYDPYVDAKSLGIYQEIPSHEFQHVNAGEIVQRILKSREVYEERQRKKGQKAVGEAEALRKEQAA